MAEYRDLWVTKKFYIFNFLGVKLVASPWGRIYSDVAESEAQALNYKKFNQTMRA